MNTAKKTHPSTCSQHIWLLDILGRASRSASYLTLLSYKKKKGYELPIYIASN